MQSDGAKDSGVEINTIGTRHLVAAVGTPDFKADYVNKKIDGWIAAIKKLTVIAASQPHAAFAAFTQCMQGQWTFLCRSMPDVAHLFVRLEDEIHLHFLPSLLRREINSLERAVLSLPARFGGLGILKPNVISVDAHENSMRLSAPLVKLIIKQEMNLEPTEINFDVKQTRMQIDEDIEKMQKAKLEQLMLEASEVLKSALKNTIE